MKQIIDYFTPDEEQSFLENQKTKALIITNFSIYVFIIILLIETILISKEDNLLIYKVIAGVSVFLLSILYILKNKGIKFTGNIFSIGIILPLVITLSFLKYSVFIIKFVQGLYLILGLLVISGIFASKKILILNSVIIIITTTKLYLYTIEQIPEKKDLFTGAYIYHTITLLLITIILYFIIKFTEKAIEKANLDAETNRKQKNTLLKMAEGIKDSSEQIFKASEQLASNSQQISSNANEQASTTEEISSSMEQMLAMINSNTDNAENTADISKKTSEELRQSNKAFVETIKAVSDISKKTSIITEIADKTDILSINASIEAARAGETGKGFAVVAHEIRNLADKTKNASYEITELSTNGNNISKIAGEKLEILIPEIIKSAELVNNIVSASKEQQRGIEAINMSVQQLTEITNENSASAEEMSASAEELSAQAEQLKKLISLFKIDDIKEVTTEKEEDKEENLTKTTKQKEKLVFEQKKEKPNINLSNLDLDNSDDEFEKF